MKKLIPVLLAVLLIFPVFADRQAMPRFAMPNPMSNGMGGPHIALTDNVYSLIVNPGAITRTNQRSFLNLAPSILSPGLMAELFGPVMDMAMGMGDDDSMSDVIRDFLTPLESQGGRIAVGLELQALPLISFASVRSGFGFAFWQRMYFDVRLNGLNSMANVYVDAMAPIGFGFKILDTDRHVVDAGITIMPFARTMANLGPVSALDLIDDVGDLMDDLSLPFIVGGSLSAGFMYRLDNGLSVGLTLNDIFSYGQEVFNLSSDDSAGNSNTTYYIPFTMDMGVAYSMPLGRLFNLDLAFSWHNVFNIFQQKDYFNDNAILDFSLGAELKIINIFNFRLGVREMLPSIGFGLELGPFMIDTAWYGREFGIEPGDFPVSTIELLISFRPEPRPTTRLWNRRSLVGLFGGPESY